MNKKKLMKYAGKVIYEGVVAVCVAAAFDVILKGVETKLDDIVEEEENNETTI